MTTFIYKNIENQDENMVNKWFKPKIDRDLLLELKKRKDLPGWINTISYFSLLIISGFIAFLSWNTWWALPCFFVYGTIYSFSNARWHEYGHRAVFKSRKLNDFFY